jgi:hypothetical protein
MLRGCFTLNGKEGPMRVAKSCANTSVYYTADLTDDTTSGRYRLRFKQPRVFSDRRWSSIRPSAYIKPSYPPSRGAEKKRPYSREAAVLDQTNTNFLFPCHTKAIYTRDRRRRKDVPMDMLLQLVPGVGKILVQILLSTLAW